jgi:cytochrome c peroxidase
LALSFWLDPLRRPRRSRFALISIAWLLLISTASAQPHPPKFATAPEPQALSSKARLGKSLFFDATLSNPVGQSCASCHSPSAGFTFPNSSINKAFGIAPGAIPNRFTSRAVPQISYSAFNPPGPPHFDPTISLYIGGQFWDGRAPDLTEQAKAPFLNPNEMNNLTHNAGDPSLVVQRVSSGTSAALFRAVYGPNVFSSPTDVVYNDIADAIAEYEKSSEVSPFSSKYDAWRAGLAMLTASELNGLRIFTGSYTGRPDGAGFPRFTHCVECHSIPSVPSSGPDLFTNTCYQNLGVPRNPSNPFYRETDPISNPVGYNPLGAAYIDYGLGDSLYRSMGLPPGNIGPGSDGRGDFLGINGSFKAPSLRNADLRPFPTFVKAYMHNGVFKSLDQVVHFYNTRNLTTQGEVIDYTLDNPYEGLHGQPLWDPPEYPNLDTLLNPNGGLGTDPGDGPGGESGAQLGNLGLTLDEEHDIVAFIKTLSDGFFNPAILGPCAITSQPVSQKTCLSGGAKFTIASNAPPNANQPLTYQWRHNGLPIPGQVHSFYTIVFASMSDGGTYDCVVTAPCANLTSRQVLLEVCPSDFNCDGQTDQSDFDAFFIAITDGDPAADLNSDGLVNAADIAMFLTAYDSGC